MKDKKNLSNYTKLNEQELMSINGGGNIFSYLAKVWKKLSATDRPPYPYDNSFNTGIRG
ncbi:MAG: hypothetical protein JXR70_17420 [Spirochaetales bacterium]|nr:hypothetical protein [Spirochaetales bacterium]